MNDNLRSPLTSSALAYTWRQLAQRIGIVESDRQKTGFESLNGPVFYGRPEQFHAVKPGIIVIPTAPDAWRKLLDRPPNSLDWFPAHEAIPSGVKLAFTDLIPVLFWGEECEDVCKPFAERQDDGNIVFYVDIVATIFFMLSRWEETVVVTRDQHDRFPATASVSYKQGFLDRPIVDEYALLFQSWLKMLAPNWMPQPRQFSVKLSHDVDFVRSVSLRTLGGDILKRRNPSKALQTVQQLFLSEMDPYLHGCYELADLSEQNGFQSAFYFMSAARGSLDSGYDPRARSVQRLMQGLRQHGHEVGFHPGYETLHDPDRFRSEKQRMDGAMGERTYGGRQHFLRFRVPYTWRLWEQAGLVYDSTLGYADHEGFRCGTCHPYHPFDIEQDRQLNLLEIPLIVMEGTLMQYRELTPEDGEASILTLAERCKQVNGVFTLLWHNTSLRGEWKPWAAMYRRVLSLLAEMESRSAAPGGQVH